MSSNLSLEYETRPCIFVDELIVSSLVKKEKINRENKFMHKLPELDQEFFQEREGYIRCSNFIIQDLRRLLLRLH